MPNHSQHGKERRTGSFQSRSYRGNHARHSQHNSHASYYPLSDQRFRRDDEGPGTYNHRHSPSPRHHNSYPLGPPRSPPLSRRYSSPQDSRLSPPPDRSGHAFPSGHQRPDTLPYNPSPPRRDPYSQNSHPLPPRGELGRKFHERNPPRDEIRGGGDLHPRPPSAPSRRAPRPPSSNSQNPKRWTPNGTHLRSGERSAGLHQTIDQNTPQRGPPFSPYCNGYNTAPPAPSGFATSSKGLHYTTAIAIPPNSTSAQKELPSAPRTASKDSSKVFVDQILSHKKKNDSILSKFSTAPGRTRPLPKRLPKSPPEDSYLTAIPSAKPKTPQDRAMVIVDLDGVSEQHPRGTSPKKFPPPNTYEKRTPRGLQQKPRTSSAISELNGSRQQQGNARRGNQRRFKNNGHGKSNSGRNGNDGVPECVPCLGRNSENSCEDEEIGASANELNIRFAADDLDILETRVSLPSQTMGGAQQSTRSSARISARSSERFRSPELNDPVPRRARDVPRKTLGRQGQTNRSKRKRATQSPDSPEDDDAVQRPTKRTSPAEICVNREWEHAPCIKEYVSERLRTFLEAQRSLISLSFMGITSDDLRSLLEIWWGDETTKEELDFITRIDLSNNNIGSLSDDICTKLSLAPLSGLFLSCNMLTSIAGRLGLMSKLEFLDLSRNKLISLPQEICELKNLKVLDVSRNEIDRLPPSLSLLKDLEVLNASYNKLTCLPDDVATEHSQLFALDLSHNPEFVFFPTCVEYWSQLEDVGIEQTKIERLLPNKDLKDLRRAPAEVLRDIAGRDEKMLKERSSRRIPRSSRGATDVVSL